MRDSDATPVRLTLVAEDPLARGALSRALSEQGSDLVVSVSGTLAEVESSSPEAAADVVLWDVGLHPAGSGGQLEAPARDDLTGRRGSCARARCARCPCRWASVREGRVKP